MRRLFTFLAAGLMIIRVASAQTVIYVDNCSTNVSDGLYTFHGVTNGKNEYRANRSYPPGYVIAPQIVSWNSAANAGAGQWEVIVYVAAFGPPSRQVVAVNPGSNAFNPLDPPETGWTSTSPGCSDGISLRVPEDRVSLGGNWSEASTWNDGRIPRGYDNVVISENTILDMDAGCYNLTLNNPAAFLGGEYKLTVLGNAGGVSAIYNSELIMAGAAGQTLGIFPRDGKITISNQHGVSLSAHIGPNIYSGSPWRLELQFASQGHLFLGDYNISVNSITGADRTRHVVTDGAGSLSINATVLEPPSGSPLSIMYEKEFPVSRDGLGYTPLQVSLQPLSGYGPPVPGGGTIPYYQALQFTVKALSLSKTPPHSGFVDVEWEISKTVPPSSGRREGLFTLKFNWDDTDESNHFDREANVVAKRYNTVSAIWENRSSTGLVSGTGPFSFTVANQGDFSSWGIFNVEAPLPVTLTSFDIQKENQTARLTWATTAETNSSHFDVERSGNAKNWQKIGQTAAHRESQSVLQYAFVDAEINSLVSEAGLVYYRLKIVDMDGTHTYSAIKSLGFKNAFHTARLYPNPASDRVTLGLTGPEEITSVRIFSLAGNEWPVKLPNDLNNPSLDLSHLPAGIYLLKISRRNSPSETHRVVIGR